MTTERIPKGAGAILWTLVGLVIWLCLATGIWLYVNKKEEVKSYVVPKHISDRMKKVHGTPVVLVGWNGGGMEDGELTFERDGQRCKF